jgi:hypothetical protein
LLELVGVSWKWASLQSWTSLQVFIKLVLNADWEAADVKIYDPAPFWREREVRVLCPDWKRHMLPPPDPSSLAAAIYESLLSPVYIARNGGEISGAESNG